MNKITTDLGITKGPLAFTFDESGGEPIVTTLPPDGVLVVRAGQSSCFTLANGSVLKGVRWETMEGAPLADELAGPWQMPLIVVEAESGGYAVCMPESLDVVESQERLYVVGARPVYLSENTFQIFLHRYDLGSGPEWRTKISNWTPDASSTTYTPSTPADFDGAPPTTQQQFNDRVAAALAGLLGAPIP
jgi:hypothetical protein